MPANIAEEASAEVVAHEGSESDLESGSESDLEKFDEDEERRREEEEERRREEQNRKTEAYLLHYWTNCTCYTATGNLCDFAREKRKC